TPPSKPTPSKAFTRATISAVTKRAGLGKVESLPTQHAQPRANSPTPASAKKSIELNFTKLEAEIAELGRHQLDHPLDHRPVSSAHEFIRPMLVLITDVAATNDQTPGPGEMNEALEHARHAKSALEQYFTSAQIDGLKYPHFTQYYQQAINQLE